MKAANDLNPAQQAALQALEQGSVAVLAGPGSGKTHTLTAAVSSVLERQPAAKLLCLTFTIKAAEQLRTRLPARNGLFIGTFHALAAHVLQAGGATPVPIADTETLSSILGQLKRSRDLQGIAGRELGLIISRYKNGSLDTPAARQLVTAYDAALAEHGVVDYDDLILRALGVGPRTMAYDYIFVDEFQDTSPKQYELLQSLSGRQTRLLVIGDPYQSIYRFRGADGSAFTRLQADSRPQRIDLTANYRSTRAVVQAANRLFEDRQPQQAVRQDDGTVRCVRTVDEYTEADYVQRIVEYALGGTEWQHTHHDLPSLPATAFGDFAVLYRTRRQGELLAQKLRNAGLPVQCLGEDSPYASPPAQLVLTLLRYTLQTDEPHWQAVELAARRAKLALRPEQLSPIDDQATPTQIIRAIAALTRQQAVPIIRQLENQATRFSGIAELLNYIDNLAEQSFFDPTADAICLSTIHSSKGLEFRHVFVTGCLDGVLPSKRAREPEDMAEELRLFYVAVTRARDSLTLLCTQQLNGKPAQPSPFLEGLAVPIEADEQLAAIAHSRARRRQKRAQQRLF